MGRKRGFDRDQALDRAMHAFWKQGYSNTSLRDLLDAMEIGEGSFYNFVSSKKALFLESMQRYNTLLSARRLEALEQGITARAGAEAFFRVILDDLENPETPPVCLMAASLSQDVLSEVELQDYVLGCMRDFEAAFAARFEHAKAEGELAEDFDSRLAAEIVVTFLQGFFRVVRVLKPRADMERQVMKLLDGIGLPRNIATVAASAPIR